MTAMELLGFHRLPKQNSFMGGYVMPRVPRCDHHLFELNEDAKFFLEREGRRSDCGGLLLPPECGPKVRSRSHASQLRRK